jgi:hypothetical protein
MSNETLIKKAAYLYAEFMVTPSASSEEDTALAEWRAVREEISHEIYVAITEAYACGRAHWIKRERKRAK